MPFPPHPEKLSAEVSERITLLRFLLIVGVVVIHAYDVEIEISGEVLGVSRPDGLAAFSRDLISQGIARTAVPLFYLLAGYFFFWNFEWSARHYALKLKSRLHTLLIPFLCWSGLNLAFLAVAQNVALTKSYFSGVNQPVLVYSFYDYVNQIFGLEGFPVAYQFWFIRDLMVVVLFAPVFYLCIKSAPRTVLALLSCLWFFNQWLWYIPSVGAVTFFYAGSYMALHKRDLFGLDPHFPQILIAYVIVLVGDTLLKDASWSDYLNRLGILLGMIAVLSLTKSFVRIAWIRASLLWASSGSFFVFAIHEPLLRILRKVSYTMIKPTSNLSVLTLYFFIPAVVVGLSLSIFILLKAVTPRFLRVITGGRTPSVKG